MTFEPKGEVGNEYAPYDPELILDHTVKGYWKIDLKNNAARIAERFEETLFREYHLFSLQKQSAPEARVQALFLFGILNYREKKYSAARECFNGILAEAHWPQHQDALPSEEIFRSAHRKREECSRRQHEVDRHPYSPKLVSAANP